MNYKGHIVFDCDETLISSREAIIQDIHKLLNEFLGITASLRDIRSFYTPDLKHIFSFFKVDISTPEKRDVLTKKWQEITRKNKSTYMAFDGVGELLTKLKDDGYALYIWTMRDRQSTTSILRDVGMYDFFKDMRCGDDTYRKPSPKALEEMVAGVPKKSVFMIGDGNWDMQGAKNYGCQAIGAHWGDPDGEFRLKKAGADFMAEWPMECYQILNNYFSEDLANV